MVVSCPCSSRYAMVLLKILCLQCSDQVWASASSSTSVGSVPSPYACRRCCRCRIAKIGLDGVHLGEAERPEPFLTQVHERLIVALERNGAHLRWFVQPSDRGRQKGFRHVSCQSAAAVIRHC